MSETVDERLARLEARLAKVESNLGDLLRLIESLADVVRAMVIR